MKKFIIFCFLLSTIKANSQVTIPFKFLKPTVTKIVEASAQQQLNTEETPNFYFFPSIKFQDYFEKEKTGFFQKNVVSYNDSLSNIALYSEIANDYIGPVRISAGVSLAYPKTDTNSVEQQKINRKTFVQKLSTGGGTLVFNFVLPVFIYQCKLFNANMSMGPRFSLDPPSFEVTSGKFAHNTALGADVQAELLGVKKIFTFYGNGRLGYVAGNSAFYNALSLTSENRKGFWLNSYTIGVNIKDVFTLSYTKFWGSKSVADKLSGFLTFTVEPNFK